MAQKWAIGSLLAAFGSTRASLLHQNEIAHFLWPQIPENAVPYPPFDPFPDFNHGTSKPPRSNHSAWGSVAFPVAGIGSYYCIKYTLGVALMMLLRKRYKTGPTTPRWMSLNETFRVFSPSIVQHSIAFSIAFPFATFAKVFRDGPGVEYDREFYRTGVEDNTWDFMLYENPEPERPLLDSPESILSLIQGDPYQRNEDHVDEHPIALEHPGAEGMDDEAMLTWYYAQLGIGVEKVRELPKKWLKLREDYNPILDHEEPLKLAYRKPNKRDKNPFDESGSRTTDVNQFDYKPELYAINAKTPAGVLPNFGATGGDGMRLPWRAKDVLKGNVGSKTSLLTEQQFFDPEGTKERELRQRTGLDPIPTQTGLDEDGNPVEVAMKYADLIRGNATATSKDMDIFALEKRKAKEDMANPWQSYYYHPNSVVGRSIPTGARIQVDPHDQPWKLDSDLEKAWIQTGKKAKERIGKPHKEGMRPTITPASKDVVFQRPDYTLTPGYVKAALEDVMMDVDEDGNPDISAISAKEMSKRNFLNPPEQQYPLPGYSYGRSTRETQLDLENQQLKVEHKGKLQELPTGWLPYEVKGLVKNRHQYYTGRGARYADELNWYTKEPAYDPNKVPAHPHGMSMSIQEAEDYYTEIERDDYEYAKSVAGSFQKQYGVPFPQFDQPELFNQDMLNRFPHLEKENKRLEMQTRYFNSLEDRIIHNPPKQPALTPEEKKLKQTTAQITRNKFNPTLYRTSKDYRKAWQLKYPALQQLGPSATADQIDYVLSFAAPSKDESKKDDDDKVPALVPTYNTDRYVREAVEQDKKDIKKMSRLFEQYESPLAESRKELTPRDLLRHEELHRQQLHGNQPVSEQTMRKERQW